MDMKNDKTAQIPIWEKGVGFIFGVIFLTALLIINLVFPNPTPTQYETFKIILALAAAGVGGILAGFIHVEGTFKRFTIRAGGALALFAIVFFFKPAMPAQSTTLNIYEGGMGIVADSVNMGISLRDHENALKQREKEVLERLAVFSPTDRVIREILQKELDDVTSKLANLEQSYKDEIKTREAVVKTLEEFKNKLPSTKASTAIEKMKQGDKEAAKVLFDDVIAQAEQTSEFAAKAAFENGRMAENDIRYLEAKNYYTKAVQFQPSNVAYTNALASILYELGDYDKAIAFLEQALASTLKTLGEDHPDVARARNNLGVMWDAKGDYDKAIAFYEQALASHLKTFGEDHSDVATARHNLGAAWKAKGDYDRAIAFYEQALASIVKTLGEDHPDVATTRNNLGAALYQNGHYSSAARYFDLALKTRLKVFGKDHLFTKQSMEWLELVQSKLNDQPSNK